MMLPWHTCYPAGARHRQLHACQRRLQCVVPLRLPEQKLRALAPVAAAASQVVAAWLHNAKVEAFKAGECPSDGAN
jgi:hypothetical protein